jgi:hypothetical protein
LTTAVGWCAAGGELSGGAFGFPSLSFGDGLQKQYGRGGMLGSVVGAFLLVRLVLRPWAGWMLACCKDVANPFALSLRAETALIRSLIGVVSPTPVYSHDRQDAHPNDLTQFRTRKEQPCPLT